jgi:DnaJ like chaperone protein
MLALLLNRPYQRAVVGRLNGSTPEIVVPDGGRTEELVTMAVFAVMGRVAKMDGRVTRSEIRFASIIMKLMSIKNEKRQQAISYFEQGKQPNTDVIRCVELMHRFIGSRSVLAHLFLKIQIRMSHIKGDMRLAEKVMLIDMAEVLGYDRTEFLAICDQMQRRVESSELRARSFLNNAYKVLLLKEGVEDSEIRRAYLRLMSRYHPDKLAKDNLSEESLKRAQVKSTAIRSAYETVCGHRKIRA